jgi:hypothetical protein
MWMFSCAGHFCFIHYRDPITSMGCKEGAWDKHCPTELIDSLRRASLNGSVFGGRFEAELI